MWSDQALAELEKPTYEYNGKLLTEYEATQIQRNNERKIRRWKREEAAMKAAGEDPSEAASKKKLWQRRQKTFLEDTGLKRDRSREQIVVASVKKSDIIGAEMFHKTNGPERPFKRISDKRFNELIIPLKKKGVVVFRGDKATEEHLKNNNASASVIADAMFFRDDVCISEVIEEIRHFEQNLMHMNDDKSEPMRTLLNEIEAREYIIENAKKYGVPRAEISHVNDELQRLKKILKEKEELP